MCGLAGIVNSKLTEKEYSAFNKLLMLSHWRGEDATGVVWAHDYWEKGARKISVNFLKDAIDSPLFLQKYSKAFLQEYKKNKPKAIMGHCRWATVGDLDRKNAHPFNNKWLIGMHNGTITGTFENSKKFATDSEALLYNIGEKGLIAALEPLKYRAPAYALTWFDKKDNSLNFFRNDARPLWFARNSEGTIAWASEKQFLEFVLPREKIPVDMLYTIKKHNLFKVYLDIPECTAVKNIEWKDHEEDLQIKVYTAGHTFRESSFPISNLDKPLSSTSLSSEYNELDDEIKQSQLDLDGKEPAEPDDMIFILNTPVEKDEYLFKLKKGCSWCSWKLDWNTRNSANFINEHEFICDSCKKMDGVEEYIKEEQAKYWAEVKTQYLAQNPLQTEFKPRRQLSKEKRAKILDKLEKATGRKKEVLLDDAPWDENEAPWSDTVSIH